MFLFYLHCLTGYIYYLSYFLVYLCRVKSQTYILFESIRQSNRNSYFGFTVVVALFVIGFYKTDQMNAKMEAMEAKIEAYRLEDKEEKKVMNAKIDRNFILTTLITLAGVLVPLLIK